MGTGALVAGESMGTVSAMVMDRELMAGSRMDFRVFRIRIR